MENKIRQKRIDRLKRRKINISQNRNNKEYIIIYANKNYRLTEEQIKSIKMDLLTPKGLTLGKINKDYNIKILGLRLNKTLTNKGILVRQGKGKGKFITNAYYLTENKPCIILYPFRENIQGNIINILLNKFISKYTFFSYKNLL